MAFSHGTAARMWIDGFPSACNLNEFSMEGTVDTAETTTLCKDRKTYIPGLEDATASMSGFFETNTLDPETTFNYFLEERSRTVFPVVYYPDGGESLGSPAYFLDGFLTSYSVGTTVDEAATVEMEFQSNTGWERGIVLSEDTLVDTDGESVYHDNGASTANGGSAILSVGSALGTSPELDVVIEHTGDNPEDPDPVWVTLATFATQTMQGAQYIEFTGTVEQYTRVVWTLGGTTPEFTFNVAIHRN